MQQRWSLYWGHADLFHCLTKVLCQGDRGGGAEEECSGLSLEATEGQGATYPSSPDAPGKGQESLWLAELESERGINQDWKEFFLSLLDPGPAALQGQQRKRHM